MSARTAFSRRPVRLAALFLFALAVWAGPGHGEEAAPWRVYLHGIEDLPLMPALTELDEAGIVFDKPAGRIVISLAEGQVTPAEVRAFYAKTLPQLGWRPKGAGLFHREGEVLRIEFETDVSPLRVRFSLSPD